MTRYLPKIGANPIIVKELRSRMRGWRAFATLTGVLLLLGIVSLGLYQITLLSTRYTTAPVSPQVGQNLFLGLVYMELLLVCGITPAVTAGAISGEHEKLTFEMLMATPLRPAAILWGKLISSLSFVFLLLFAAVPMASLVFIFGGVAMRDMAKALVILVVVAVMLGMLGLFMSALFGRTGRATVLSYLVVIVMLFGPLFLTVVAGILRQGEPARWLLVPSPLSALASALNPSTNMAGGMISLLGGMFWQLTGSAISQTGIPRPLYHYSVPFFGGLTLLFYLLSMRLILPARRWKFTRRELLIALAVVLIFGGLVAAAFLGTSSRYEGASIFSAPPTNNTLPEQRGVFVERAVPPPPVVPVEPAIVLPDENTPTPDTPPYPAAETGNTGPDDEAELSEQSAIYMAVVRQLYTVDHTFGDQPPEIPTLYLVGITDDTVGDPDAPKEAPAELNGKIRELLIQSLQDLPSKVVWVEAFGEVPIDNQGIIKGGGAIITLGNIHTQKDGTRLVSASLYFGSLAATGKTYILAVEDGVWKVVGSTGVEWIS